MAGQDQDHGDALLEQVNTALATGRPLVPRGAGSKTWLGRPVDGDTLETGEHRGIVHYDPSELVITVRAGTPITEVIDQLQEQDQMLPFEPPLFGARGSIQGTIGGMVATGLAGPRRPWAGSVRDFVLGTRVITGEGKHLRFGGEVMKNVAGYDLSRLMAASFGALGLITEVSFKVLPRPRECLSRQLTMTQPQALQALIRWRREGLPLSAACHGGGVLRVRLEGHRRSVQQAAALIGGDPLDDTAFWDRLRDHRLPFFDGPKPLWRLSLPADTPALDLPGPILFDWAGAQRWLKSDADADSLRTLADHHGGAATCYNPAPGVAPFHPLPEPLMRYHQALKAKLDPKNLFNPGRLYADL